MRVFGVMSVRRHSRRDRDARWANPDVLFRLVSTPHFRIRWRIKFARVKKALMGLDALAHADDGLGLTALAHASGLAKTSTYRLAQQLVALGAVQCIEHRYYIGALIGRIGQRGQPDPLLRRAAHGRARWRRCGSCTKNAFV